MRLLAVAIGAACALAACDSGGILTCPNYVNYGIEIQVRRSDGVPLMIGTTLQLDAPGYQEINAGGVDPRTFLNVSDSLTATMGRRAGVYSLLATRPHYRYVVVPAIRARGDGCGPYENKVTHVRVTLTPLPDAPAVRSVTLWPHDAEYAFLASRDGLGWYAFVDAASGSPTNVQWRSSDTAVAFVSGSGILRRCPSAGGAALITVVSVADTTQRDTISVDMPKATAPCPP